MRAKQASKHELAEADQRGKAAIPNEVVASTEYYRYAAAASG